MYLMPEDAHLGKIASKRIAESSPTERKPTQRGEKRTLVRVDGWALDQSEAYRSLSFLSMRASAGRTPSKPSSSNSTAP